MNINSSAAILSAKCCRLLYAILLYIILDETCQFNGKGTVRRGILKPVVYGIFIKYDFAGDSFQQKRPVFQGGLRKPFRYDFKISINRKSAGCGKELRPTVPTLV